MNGEKAIVEYVIKKQRKMHLVHSEVPYQPKRKRHW